MITITNLESLDLRFPTSRTLAGSDAVHKDPDYSAAYVILKTDAGIEGHGLTFTVGRGNELCVAAIESMRHLVVGKRLADITADFAGFWRSLASESQLRWLGPEKGVIHLALRAERVCFPDVGGTASMNRRTSGTRSESRCHASAIFQAASGMSSS